MKIAFAIAAAALLFLTTPSIARESSPLKFNEMEYNFGTIHEEGRVVTHEFSFVNSSDNPVAIDRVNVSCGCTSPKFPKRPIQPGERATIEVSFNPMGYPGDFSKSVVVVSGGGNYYDMLIITGRVTPRVKRIEDEYPVEMAAGLRIDNTTLTFRQVAQGKASSMTIGYVNSSDKTISVEVRAVEPSTLIEINAPETICAGCKGQMTFTYNLTDKKGHYGMIHDLFQFVVDGTVSTRTLYTAMIGVDDFSGQSIEIAPKFTLAPQFHNYGEVRRRAMPYVQRMVATNDGEETLYIRSVTSKTGLKTTLREGMSIAPGATLPFELLLYSDKYISGEVNESLIIVTNDPLRPVREIRISVKIK